MLDQDKTRVLLQGTVILALAALLSKLLGVIYRIPYQNITGNLGFYVYQQVYPIYSILLILATAGFPLAVSKLVAERMAVGDVVGAKKIFQISMYILSITGLLCFLILYGSAPIIASWMEDARLVMPIRSVSFALLIVPVMAAMRGYFQGHQNMMPTAVSQIVEQIVRVGTILLLSYWFIHNNYDAYYAGAGAVFGAFTGAISAFFVLLFYWKRNQRKQADLETTFHPRNESALEAQLESQFEAQSPNQTGNVGSPNRRRESEESEALTFWHVTKRILYYAIPICLGTMVLPLFQLVDALTVVKVLIHSQWEHIQARELKGIFDRGQPLVQFAAFFATALALALVPSIAEANVKNDRPLIAARAEIAMRLTLFIGLAASFGLSILAEPINIMLYKTNEGTLALAVLAFTTVFSTIGIASGAVLQGLGHVMLPARNLLVGIGVKVTLNLLLIPVWDIAGAALATVVAYAVATVLNLISLHRYTGLKLTFISFFAKPIIAVVTMATIVWLTMEGLTLGLQGVIGSDRLFYTVVALVSVGVGALIYGVALLRFGAVTREELASIPRVNRIVPLLDRLKILKL